MLKIRVFAVLTRCSRTTSPSATLASRRSSPLTSSTLPKRPMAVNVGPDRLNGAIMPSSIRTSSSVIDELPIDARPVGRRPRARR